MKTWQTMNPQVCGGCTIKTKTSPEWYWAVLGLWLLCASVEAAEPYYKWVDEAGVVNYASEKPQGIDAKLVSDAHRFGETIPERPKREPPPPRPIEIAPGAAEPADNQAQFEQSLREAKAAKRQNCVRARDNLSKFQERGRIRVPEENNRVMTDEEKAAKVQQFEEAIKENC
jgi:hypothetical protein